jgi:hypothetical protein
MDTITWLKAKILEQVPIIRKLVINQGEITPDEFLDLWVTWLIQHGFVKLFGTEENPTGYIIARPGRISWVYSTDINYLDTLFWFDENGDVAWIDSLWAPGQYAQVLIFLRSTTKTFTAWEHNGRVFFKEIAQLTGQIPKRREIEEAFLRHA